MSDEELVRGSPGWVVVDGPKTFKKKDSVGDWIRTAREFVSPRTYGMPYDAEKFPR